MAGVVFLGAYAGIARKPLAPSVIALYLLLLAAYSAFAPQMRWSSTHPAHRALWPALAGIALLYGAALSLLQFTGWSGGTISLVMLQGATLMLAARVLDRLARGTSTTTTS
jgi:hypothetical protein